MLWTKYNNDTGDKKTLDLDQILHFSLKNDCWKSLLAMLIFITANLVNDVTQFFK